MFGYPQHFPLFSLKTKPDNFPRIRNYNKGFYVYVEPKKFTDFKSGDEYITRYCDRVPISKNRIINYDGSNVTFSFIDHKDNKYHEVTLSSLEFIIILLRHFLKIFLKMRKLLYSS